jgi:hypothetical protein
VRLRELVHEADLGLSIVEAEDSRLGAEVRRTYVTDLPDPSRFLHAGDLVLTLLGDRVERPILGS